MTKPNKPTWLPMLFVRVGVEICPKCKRQSGWEEAPDPGFVNSPDQGFVNSDEKEVAVKIAGEMWFIGYYKEHLGERKSIMRARHHWVCEECGFRWDQIIPKAEIQ